MNLVLFRQLSLDKDSKGPRIFLVLHVVGGRSAVIADFRVMGGNRPVKGSVSADSCQQGKGYEVSKAGCSDLIIASVFDKQVQ